MTFPAILWDMDGTLVDTEPQWLAGEQALARAHDAIWTEEDSLALVGSDLRQAARYIQHRLGSDESIDAIIEQLGHRVATSLVEHIDWRPGARELFKEFEQRGVPQALVTMSYGYIAQPVIDQLNFDVVVTGDIVERGKPHPDPYLLAARLLGVDPQHCFGD